MFNGQPISVSSSIAEILMQFLDALPANACVLDRSGTVVAVNAAWRRFAVRNACRGFEWVGANYLAIADAAEDEDAGIVGRGLRAVLAGALDSFEHEYPCHAPNHPRWFRCVVSPLRDAEGGGVWAASVLHFDVSGRRAAEEQAWAASKAKSDFLASLSHELRTPLNAIIGFAEMLGLEMWGPLGDKHYREYAVDIQDAGRHLLSMINDVLDLSKVEAGKMEVAPQVFGLGNLVEQCLHVVEGAAAKSRVTLDRELDPAADDLYADPRLVRQLLLNLLSNAIKFTPAEGRVTASTRREGNGWVRLAVSDTGIGIAAADQPLAMKPFGQVRHRDGRIAEQPGTGLGLPLCKRFAELHGGQLSMASEPGLGTTVTVLFPPRRPH